MFWSRLPTRIIRHGALAILVAACSKGGGDSSPTGTGSTFSPTANTGLSGAVTYGTVNIPAGVTVTVTGSLTLTVTGAMTLSGSLVGDCAAITIKVTGQFSLTNGTLNNSCSVEPDAGGPGLQRVAEGGLADEADEAGGDVLVAGFAVGGAEGYLVELGLLEGQGEFLEGRPGDSRTALVSFGDRLHAQSAVYRLYTFRLGVNAVYVQSLVDS